MIPRAGGRSDIRRCSFSDVYMLTGTVRPKRQLLHVRSKGQVVALLLMGSIYNVGVCVPLMVWFAACDMNNRIKEGCHPTP